MYIKSNSRFCINDFQPPKAFIPPNVFGGLKHLMCLKKMAQTRFDNFNLSTGYQQFINTLNKENEMKKYRMRGPDGSWWETTATSLNKAKVNFIYRLRMAGMFITDARSWSANTEEVKP